MPILNSEIKPVARRRSTIEKAPQQSFTNLRASVVLAITKENVDASPTLFQSYGTNDSLRDCTIWEVARATSAATTFFKSIKCGRDGIGFIDAAFGYNNPCEILLKETGAIFPGRNISCILSIGTGLKGPVSIANTRRSIIDALKAMATTSQKVAKRMDDIYQDGETYFRFDVSQGLEDITLSDWKELSKIAAHTRNYLTDEDRQIARCSIPLSQYRIPITLTEPTDGSLRPGESERRTSYPEPNLT